MKTVLIAIPKGRQFIDLFVTSLLTHFMFEQTYQDFEFRIAFADSAPYGENENNPDKHHTIGMLREKLIQEAITEQYDYIWFLDDDMYFPPNTFRRLVSHDKDFVTSIAHLKAEPFLPNILSEKTTFDPKQRLVHVQYDKITEYPDGGLLPIAACGLACAVIKVSAINHLKSPFFTIPGIQPDSVLGEDVAFCRRFMEAGIPIFADCGSKIGHIDTKNDRLITEIEFKHFYAAYRAGNTPKKRHLRHRQKVVDHVGTQKKVYPS